MKYSFLLLTAIVIMLISCEKEEDDIKTDNILFSDLDSSITASTVRDWDIEDRGVCKVDIPIPGDSSTSIHIDINNDSKTDFIIELSHNYWVPTQYCGHCSIYEYDIKIRGANGSDSIASMSNSPIAAYFGYSDKISLNNTWTNEAILVMRGGCVRPTFIVGNDYIALKHNNQIAWMKIEEAPDNGLTIKNYAINLTENRSIKAGQKE